VLAAVKALGFAALVPGHGPVERDTRYIDLLSETIRTIGGQMKALAAQGLSREEAVARADYAAVEPRFTHGDPFLAHRFEDYVRSPLADAAYTVATGKPPEEAF
jgi:hypothetical protein